jgi:hypothetical protein
MSNCLLYVVGQWVQRGGWVLLRQSHYGWWPHFVYSEDLVLFEEYVPLIPNHHLILPPPLYQGYVRRFYAPSQL